jgi:hypothetical protein
MRVCRLQPIHARRLRMLILPDQVVQRMEVIVWYSRSPPPNSLRRKEGRVVYPVSNYRLSVYIVEVHHPMV